MDTIAPLTAALAGRYDIGREIGHGGMATVYLARDVKHDRNVALKVLHAELGVVLGAERFLTEIRTTANLQHPNILPLFDSGAEAGLVFYVMPYVEGETLRDRIKREGQLSVADAVRIARAVASALDYAHRRGVIHRDIKPENILLQEGQPLVADFGVALAVSSAGGTRVTQTGISVGTPHYMSPEQAAAERQLDGRSDQYSLASVVYELLAGQPPFTGPSAPMVMSRLMTETPRLITELRPSVPPHVADALATALEKVPSDRFAGAGEFAEALVTEKTGTFRTRAAPAMSRSARWPVAVSAAVAVVATVAAIVGWRRPAPATNTRHVQFIIEPADSIVSINRCCGPAQALSPDGSTLVYVGMRTRGGALYRRSLDRLTSELIPGTEGGASVFFSPDGSWLGFEAEGQLKKVLMSGGPPVPIATTGPVNGASWGDDDVIVFSAAGANLWRVPASGGKPVPVPLRDSSTRLVFPFVLPGAKFALADARQSGGNEDWRTVAVDLSSGAVERIGLGTHAAYASGSLVFSTGDNSLLAQPFDLARRKTTGPATTIVTGVSFSGNTMHEFSVSTNGWLEYEIGRNDGGEQLRAMGAGASAIIPLPGRGLTNLEDPAISPDGRRIVVRLPAGTNSGDLWIIDRRNNTLNRFTVGGGAAPSWSRDGRFIAYYSGGDSTVKPGIYVAAVDQTGAPTLVRTGRDLYPGSWLPDGRSITFNTNGGTSVSQVVGSYDIGMVTLGDTTIHWLVKTEFSERHPQVSPDGRLLAFISNRTGKAEVYVQPLVGGGAPVQISSDGANSPRWGKDSRTLFYVANNLSSIVAATLAAGPAIAVMSRSEIATMLSIDINAANVNWDVFPDGKQILVIDQSGGEGRRRMGVVQNWPAMARAMGSKQ